MARQFKFFMIPAASPEEAEAELNRFLSSTRTTLIQRELVLDGRHSFWSVVVEYGTPPGKGPSKPYGPKIDYRDVLSEENFALFTKIRDWRLEKSKTESVKAYVILTDAQLAKIAERRPDSKSAMLAIEGIGEARVEKYGDDILKIVADNAKRSPTVSKAR